MNYSKTLKDLTPEELGNYAQNMLITNCPLIMATDYTQDPIKEIAKLTISECEEITRYANVLAEKGGLGKDYFNLKKAKKNLPIFADKKSNLERVCSEQSRDHRQW